PPLDLPSFPTRRSSDLFGAFVEILPGTDGLVHISQIAEQRIKSVSDVLREGEEILVKVIEIDKQGRVKLSRREALRESQGNVARSEEHTSELQSRENLV